MRAGLALIFFCLIFGTPEGIYSAGVGTMFINKTGSTSSTLFLKVSGSGNTGWVAK
jgi:hypothetical protein